MLNFIYDNELRYSIAILAINPSDLSFVGALKSAYFRLGYHVHNIEGQNIRNIISRAIRLLRFDTHPDRFPNKRFFYFFNEIPIGTH